MSFFSKRNSTQTGLKRIDNKDLNSGFAFLSTPDVIKTLQLMPGVSSGTELLSLEITYPADEEGHPDPEGKDLLRKYLVQAYYGGTYGDNSLMMEYLNLSKLSVATRASFDEMDVYYNNSFRVVDITDGTNPENAEHFYMSSATIIPWILE